MTLSGVFRGVLRSISLGAYWPLGRLRSDKGEKGRSHSLGRVEKPVVIVGCMRSGTTFLFRLLQEHPQLIPTVGPPDGENTLFWAQTAGASISGFYKPSNMGPIGGTWCNCMRAADANEGVAERVNAELLAGYPGLRAKGRRLLSKNPHLSNKLGFLKELFPDIHLIHIVRNPYAVVASLQKMFRRFERLEVLLPSAPESCFGLLPRRGKAAPFREAVGGSERYIDGECSSVRALANYWLNTNDFVVQQLQELGEVGYTCIRYEDLCCDMMMQAARLVSEMELSPKHKWKARVDSSAMGSWRRSLSKRDIALVSDELGEGIHRWGYALA